MQRPAAALGQAGLLGRPALLHPQGTPDASGVVRRALLAGRCEPQQGLEAFLGGVAFQPRAVGQQQARVRLPVHEALLNPVQPVRKLEPHADHRRGGVPVMLHALRRPGPGAVALEQHGFDRGQ